MNWHEKFNHYTRIGNLLFGRKEHISQKRNAASKGCFPPLFVSAYGRANAPHLPRQEIPKQKRNHDDEKRRKETQNSFHFRPRYLAFTLLRQISPSASKQGGWIRQVRAQFVSHLNLERNETETKRDLWLHNNKRYSSRIFAGGAGSAAQVAKVLFKSPTDETGTMHLMAH
ncbi:hypothetical protein HG535_0E00360 [Zygotorulaspora mrakii]|uniref:Uncharacterized protein n=1 Tax=Zygotorulaspora mrakii TaxID=42260 RepID=A0A7H9B5A6_ZYGMR|nr:uncharacterized protein HG535_0E00360 [Zygotorulaspora mrakii]QLG72952.1 hypothetical protein HG535_0E00360 [Zygotorulaspora mrakii]